MGHVRIEAENAAAALEVISRSPRSAAGSSTAPTMSPSETSKRKGLRNIRSAFAYFERVGVGTIVGGESIWAAGASRRRPRRGGARGGASATCGPTRIGLHRPLGRRPFFADDALERALLERLVAAFSGAGFWQKFETDWACLDAERMPWSAKAQSLIAETVRPVALPPCGDARAADVVSQAVARGLDAARCANACRQSRQRRAYPGLRA